MWLWVKTNWYHLGRGDWDVHWGLTAHGHVGWPNDEHSWGLPSSILVRLIFPYILLGRPCSYSRGAFPILSRDPFQNPCAIPGRTDPVFWERTMVEGCGSHSPKTVAGADRRLYQSHSPPQGSPTKIGKNINQNNKMVPLFENLWRT